MLQFQKSAWSVYIPLFSFSKANGKWKMENGHPFSIFWSKWKMDIHFPFSIFHRSAKIEHTVLFFIFWFSIENEKLKMKNEILTRMKWRPMNAVWPLPTVCLCNCALQKMSTPESRGDKTQGVPSTSTSRGTCPPVHPRIYAHVYITP